MKLSRLEELHQKQRKLKDELQFREQKLNEKIEYLEDNFGSMLLNSVSPFNASERARVSGVFNKINDFIFGILPGKEAEKKELHSGILKSVQMIISGIAFRYLKKVLGKFM